MIPLFNIPQHKIDTSKFSNLLHDKIVTEFEKNLADYVGAKYCCSFNSATSAIFLLMSWIKENFTNYEISIPSVIPPVVPNALINAGVDFWFNNGFYWVGSDYLMTPKPISGLFNIIDSAHRLDEGQFNEYQENDIVIFSFYPTKPVSGCDGGAVVSNNKGIIDLLRYLSTNGSTELIGHKMYMNSIQAYIANENLKNIEKKYKRIDEIREYYSKKITNCYHITSRHLFIIKRDVLFMANCIERDGVIEVKKHYRTQHDNELYSDYCNDYKCDDFTSSSVFNWECVSIPYHEALTDEEVETVIKYCNEHE